MNFSFNGIKKDYISIDNNEKRPSWAPLQRNLLYVKGVEGANLESTDIRERILSVPIQIRFKGSSDFQKLKEELASWLLYEDEKELIFDDEPDRVYFALVDGPLDFDELVRFGRGTITFICPNPYKYGHKVISRIDPAEPAIIVNQGTSNTKPIFTFNTIQPTTFIDIVKDDDYMSIGRPVSVDDEVFDPRSRRLNDEMRTTAGWGEAFFQPDGGAKSGTMTILGEGEEFGATNYGSGLAWHGPMLQKTFDPCDDYYIRVRFNVRTNNSKQRARGDMYFLTTDGSQIGKVSAIIRDTSMKATIEVRLQNGLKVHYPINRLNAFDKGFYGFVGIAKEGTKFTFEIGVEAVKSSGGFNVVKKEVHHFDDINGDFQLPLAGVASYVATWGNSPLPHRARLRSVIVDKVNQQVGVPYIVKPGDEVKIDFKNELILINDELRNDLKDFGGNYFSLPPGETILVINPPDAFTATVEWRDCYK
ncbi:distal tail protein Dit [Cytobacillus purgationiresistens]|uniref:Phage tail component-like protein n=1 Tax=Cytobacillus purgationiresistens TaxID=863449 RepID=A0ABU0AD86_9BACI|nr:distal tail protein Dit [Cytobacillus purgationiresistens]MDQ0269010.1 putative phage tail component-like protein [Cytobacillus purgationiresistens]